MDTAEGGLIPVPGSGRVIPFQCLLVLLCAPCITGEHLFQSCLTHRGQSCLMHRVGPIGAGEGWVIPVPEYGRVIPVQCHLGVALCIMYDSDKTQQ